MKSRLILIVFLGILCLVLAGVYFERNKEQIASRSEATSSMAPASPLANEEAPAASTRTSPLGVSSPGGERYLPQTVSIAEIKNSDTRLIALSPEEAAWLDAHYFPTPAEMANLQNYSTEELLHRMRELKDPKAAALLGARRMMDGDIAGAFSAFASSADLGSIYGQEELAVVMPMKALHGRPLTNDARAGIVAGLEVAKILGDHRATELMRKHAPNLDRNVYGNDIQLQVTEYMRQIGSSAQSRGVKAPGPDPRPNAHLWERIDDASAGDTATVEVFTRPNSYP